MSNNLKKTEQPEYKLVESNHKGFHFYSSPEGEIAVVSAKTGKVLVLRESKIFTGYQNVKEELSGVERGNFIGQYKTMGFDDETIMQLLKVQKTNKRVKNVLDVSEITKVIADESASWKDRRHAMNFIVKKANKMIKKGWF